MGRSIVCAINHIALVAAGLCVYALVILAEPDTQSNEITLEWKQIFVGVLDDGPTFSLMVEPDENIRDLRRDINALEGIPFDHMITRIGDTELDPAKKLSDYNIRNQQVIALEIPSNLSRLTVEFKVRTLDGRELHVATQLGDSVASLKKTITQRMGIPHVEQRLLLNGKELKDDRKLVHYVDSGTFLNLGRPLEECRQVASIVVKTPSGARVEVEVNLADTVTNLKEKIWEKTGVPVGAQHLSNDARIITGEDHLCDLGLEAGSTVYMYLYSAQITSSVHVAKLREPPVNRPVDPYKAPIFREANAAAEPKQRPASLYKDARNWILGGNRPGWSPGRFDPVAHLDPNPDIQADIERYSRFIAAASNLDSDEWFRLEAPINNARLKLSLAVRPYRVSAASTSINHFTQSRPGITLGGGSDNVGTKQPISLGADVNNWAPDAFSDSDVMRLFEVAERVRRALAKAAHTGEGILSIGQQKRINTGILFDYLSALAGYPPPVEYNQPNEGEECGICRDDLVAEPATKLACGHVFHADCVSSWAANSMHTEQFASCPTCGQRFMLPYEVLGKSE